MDDTMTVQWFPRPWWHTDEEAVIVLSKREDARFGICLFRHIAIP